MPASRGGADGQVVGQFGDRGQSRMWRQRRIGGADADLLVGLALLVVAAAYCIHLTGVLSCSVDHDVAITIMPGRSGRPLLMSHQDHTATRGSGSDECSRSSSLPPGASVGQSGVSPPVGRRRPCRDLSQIRPSHRKRYDSSSSLAERNRLRFRGWTRRSAVLSALEHLPSETTQ